METKEKLYKYINDTIKNSINKPQCLKKVTDSIYTPEHFKKISFDNYNINDYIEKTFDNTNFQKLLFNIIDSKNLIDSDVYNKVNIDRRLFSKIRSDCNYHPSKNTVILLGLALELTETEIDNLLISASYSLPKNNIFDLIIRFCFKEKIYNPLEVNNLLNDYNCKLLNK